MKGWRRKSGAAETLTSHAAGETCDSDPPYRIPICQSAPVAELHIFSRSQNVLHGYGEQGLGGPCELAPPYSQEVEPYPPVSCTNAPYRSDPKNKKSAVPKPATTDGKFWKGFGGTFFKKFPQRSPILNLPDYQNIPSDHPQGASRIRCCPWCSCDPSRRSSWGWR